MRTHLLHSILIVGSLAIVSGIFSPLVNRSPHSARRSHCQSNLKQIGQALQLYALDYDEKLPSDNWAKVLVHYAGTDVIYQCPETTDTSGTSDYFFNGRFAGFSQNKISNPKTLILVGDGVDDGPLNATVSQIPSVWVKAETSPAWRHLIGANYGFADGHVKFFKPHAVSRDLRVVLR